MLEPGAGEGSSGRASARPPMSTWATPALHPQHLCPPATRASSASQPADKAFSRYLGRMEGRHQVVTLALPKMRPSSSKSPGQVFHP